MMKKNCAEAETLAAAVGSITLTTFYEKHWHRAYMQKTLMGDIPHIVKLSATFPGSAVISTGVP